MTVHSQLKSVTAVAAKLGAVALAVGGLSACVVAPVGYGHYGRGHGGHVAVEVAPVGVAPPPPVVVTPPAPRYGHPRHGYPRYYRY